MKFPDVSELVKLLPSKYASAVTLSTKSLEIDYPRLLECQSMLDFECETLLNDTDSECYQALGWLISEPIFSQTQPSGLFNRLGWIVAARGRGCNRSVEHLRSTLKSLQSLWACQTLLSPLIGDTQESFMEDTQMQAFLHRTTAMSIRYSWISREVCRQLAREVSAEPALQELLPYFNVSAINELFQKSYDYLISPNPLQSIEFKGDVDGLASMVALPQEGLANCPSELMISYDALKYPLIALRGGGYALAAPGYAAMKMEVSLLELLDRKLLGKTLLSNGKRLTKGEIFERVAQACLVRVLNGARAFPRPANVEISKTNPGDLDALFGGQGVLIIGEVKAESENRALSAGSSYGEQVRKIVRQLKDRLNTIESGTKVFDAKSRWVRTPKKLLGLGVTLHDYYGNLSNKTALSIVGPATATMAISDLHSWIMIISSLDGPKELVKFVKYRSKLITIVRMFEEHDVAICFLLEAEGKKIISNLRGEHSSNVRGMIALKVEAENIFRLDYEARNWRKDMVANAQNLSGLPESVRRLKL